MPMTRLTTIAPTRTLVLCDLPRRLSLWTAFAAVLRYAQDQAERALDEPIEAVHEYRKSVRRARALLRLARPSLGKRTWRTLDTILADQVRKTSALRDADVLRETLAALPTSLQETHAEAFISFQDHLEHNAGTLDLPNPHEVLVEAASALHLATCSLGVELPRGWDKQDLIDGLKRSYQDARGAFEAVQDHEHPEDLLERLHTFRKRIKELRYMLEALSADHPDTLASALKPQFAKLAEGLGTITDLYVLIQRLDSLDPTLPNQEALREAILDYSLELTREAAETAAELLAARPKHWAAAAIRREHPVQAAEEEAP